MSTPPSPNDKDVPSPFVWDESFLIGDPVIDAQHRRIFALVAAFESNPNQTTYNDVLNELNLHFASEDKDLRLTVGADKSAEHINGHIKSLQMFTTKTPGTSTVAAIKRWLVYHIKSEDMKFMKSGFKAMDDEDQLLDIDPPIIQNIEKQQQEEDNIPWYKDTNEIKLLFMIFLSMTFMCAEMAVGFYANSLALISDAFHMIADGISYIVAFVAILWSKRAKGKSYTFGWERSEIIGAFINGILLLAICLFITLESIQRFIELPEVTQPLLVVYVASGGVILNLIGMVMFGEIEFCCCEDTPEDDDPDLAESPTPEKVSNDNIRAVFVHIIGDLVGQLCAIASGLLIHFLTEHWRFYFDPALSLIIVLLLTKHSVPIVKRSMQVFMQRTPKFIKMDALQIELDKVPDIVSMHELHVWSLSGETTIATLHLTLLRGANFPKILFQLKSVFHSYGIHSITVQPEFVTVGALTVKHPQCLLSCDKRQCKIRPCCAPQIEPPMNDAVLHRHLHHSTSHKGYPTDEVVHSDSDSVTSHSRSDSESSVDQNKKEKEREKETQAGKSEEKIVTKTDIKEKEKEKENDKDKDKDKEKDKEKQKLKQKEKKKDKEKEKEKEKEKNTTTTVKVGDML